jgi:cytidine deaminase
MVFRFFGITCMPFFFNEPEQMAYKKVISFSVDIYNGIEELSAETRQLLQMARQSCQSAYAPYSGFWVGAALQLADGSYIEGSNQENAAYPSGLCAERTALFAKGATRPDVPIVRMAVTARRAAQELYLAANPCGACRQVMIEFENRQQSPIEVIFEIGDGKICVTQCVGDLLPLNFSQENLL